VKRLYSAPPLQPSRDNLLPVANASIPGVNRGWTGGKSFIFFMPVLAGAGGRKNFQ
jgi:hypothetical protein